MTVTFFGTYSSTQRACLSTSSRYSGCPSFSSGMRTVHNDRSPASLDRVYTTRNANPGLDARARGPQFCVQIPDFRQRRDWVDDGPTSPSKTTPTQARLETFDQMNGCAHIEAVGTGRYARSRPRATQGDARQAKVERAMGIEPTAQAWEAWVLPLYDARKIQL